MGRENLMQSAFFCERQTGLALAIYIPVTAQFSMSLENNLLHVQLDDSYIKYLDTARQHVEETLRGFQCRYSFQEPPEHYTGRIPPLKSSWAMMACPRVISEQTSAIGLGHIGPGVRALAKQAPFPVFIPSMAFKPWNAVTVFFGGSALGVLAVKHALAIARRAKVSLRIHTQSLGVSHAECKQALTDAGVMDHLAAANVDWQFYEKGSFEENLYEVDHQSLVVAGAAGHHLIKELVFGSQLEKIQSTLPNPLVVVGPACLSQPIPFWS